MERNFVFVSKSFDGHRNLAVDEWFLDHVGKEDLILHLYQNENAVIIGKNQNPWLECDLEQMKLDKVQLVRRVSGGGAVYHDEGNLNFSFICGEKRYDLQRQFALVLEGVKSLEIDASFSGRNDLVCDGKKFSGNAFATRRGNKQHHGTLLVSSDLEKLARYLTPDETKIRSKGISSVRSRVMNLSQLGEEITVKQVQKALLSAFEKEYGYYGEWQFSPREEEEIARYEKKHASDEWRLGASPKFDLEWKKRFPWGGVELLLSFEKGRIARVSAYSDAMETEISEELETCLTGVDFTDEAIRSALSSSPSPRLRQMGACSFLETKNSR